MANSASCTASTWRLSTFSGLLGKIANGLYMSNLRPASKTAWLDAEIERIDQWLFRGDPSCARERVAASTFFGFRIFSN